MPAYYGEFGGAFVPELLTPPLRELEAAMARYLTDPAFRSDLDDLLANYAGRPTPLTYCPTLSRELGIELFLKREDLLHGGAHKINNTLGQALLAKYMGKTKLIAETGAGQHGVATAIAAARLNLEAIVFMGAVDVERQAPNVARMRLLGTEVRAVDEGTRTLKDAINAALRHWIEYQGDTHYCFGTAAGPHPFPTLVAEFQRVIGQEIKEEFLRLRGALPAKVVACVGGGSNAIGAFLSFLEDPEVGLIGVEAGGTGEENCHNSAPLNLGSPGILHGQLSYLLQTPEGQVSPSHSVSAGLDYPGVGPQHSFLKTSGRATYAKINDAEALAAFQALCRQEGVIPALESSHALAWVLQNYRSLAPRETVVVNLSGRGDKDLGIARKFLRDLF
ncbi:MAG: tryptophan synthase subunit beta [Deltaproteobacteria bacterium]|jgi:tryptophan synthase beta chain|nr:tryptophan synthase subunit beta [Deltaproteobacteria bacterium]